MLPTRGEIMDFIRACETLQGLLTEGTLTHDDRTLIESRGSELLSKIRVVSAVSYNQSQEIALRQCREDFLDRRSPPAPPRATSPVSPGFQPRLIK